MHQTNLIATFVCYLDTKFTIMSMGQLTILKNLHTIFFHFLEKFSLWTKMEVIFLLVLFLNLADASDVTGPIEVCVSRDCIITAHNLLKNMNTTADPCEDFYEVTKTII